MKCDRCEAEATVHELQVIAGKRRERHLCESCAQAAGLLNTKPPPPPLGSTDASDTGLGPMAMLLSALNPGAGPLPPGQKHPASRPTPLASACPSCGMTFAQFRSAERLGCAHCYQALEAQLRALIGRVQEGAVQHVGKVPRRLTQALAQPMDHGAAPAVAPAPVDLAARARELRAQLAQAVASEHYERAAQLRDELARLPGASSGARPPEPRP
jgi:protein arginine kinase activator